MDKSLVIASIKNIMSACGITVDDLKGKGPTNQVVKESVITKELNKDFVPDMFDDDDFGGKDGNLSGFLSRHKDGSEAE